MSLTASLAPPWRVWLVVMAFVIFFFGLAYIALEHGFIVDPMNEGIVAEQWQKRHTGKPLIIGVGSSLLFASVDQSALKAIKEYEYLPFYRAAANYGNFNAFFKKSLPLKPRLIILHTDLFLQNTKSDWGFFLTLRLAIGGSFRKMLGKSPNVFENTVACGGKAGTGIPEPRKVLVTAYLKNPQSQSGLVDWIEKRRAEGILIVLIDIPRSPSVEKQLGKRLEQWRQSLDELGIPILHYRGPLDESDFCDGSHMSLKGRSVFTPWLKKNIQRLLDESH